MSGIADVMARISEIQAMLPEPVAADTSGSFAATLSAVTAAATPSTGAHMTARVVVPTAPGASAADGSSASPATTPVGAASGSATGADAVTQARRYLGVPYLWGGTDPSVGLDCSGLVQLVYKNLGVTLPRVAADQAKVGTAVPNLASARPGDLVAFGDPAHHIGIYIGDGKMIDAPHAGSSVEVDPVGTPTSIRRVLPTGEQPSVASAGLIPSAKAVAAYRNELTDLETQQAAGATVARAGMGAP